MIMKRNLSFNEVWQAMLRGKRIARRCVSKALEAYLRFHASVSGRKIFCSGNQYVLSV